MDPNPNGILAEEGFTMIRNKKWKRQAKVNPNQRQRMAKQAGYQPSQHRSRVYGAAQEKYANLNLTHRNFSKPADQIHLTSNEAPKAAPISRAWKDVVKGNFIPVYTPLELFPPQRVNDLNCAKMNEGVMRKAKQQWDNAIVIYVVGSKPYYL